MPSEILAFIQAQPQTQNAQQTIPNAPAENAQPGLFDSLMTQYATPVMAEENIEAVLMAVPEGIPETEITFSGNNSFSQAIIDILAGDVEPPEPEAVPETTAQETEDVIIWDEAPEVPEVQPEIPRPTVRPKNVTPTETEEAEYTDDTADADSPDEPEPETTAQETEDVIIRDEAPEEPEIQPEEYTAPQAVITARPEAPAKPEDTGDTEDADSPDEPEPEHTAPELPDAQAGFAGMAIAPETLPEAPATPDAPEAQNPDTDAPVSREAPHVRQPQPQTQAQPQQATTRRTVTPEAPATPDAPEAQDTDTDTTPADFRRVLDERTAQHETAQQESNSGQEQPTGQDFTQSGDRNTGSNPQRSRTDTRRTGRTEASRPQPERTASTTNTHRANSFQAFFEGAVNTRRTQVQGSAIPMNLRGTYNFTQAQTLRNGLVNVVRFIRADGVQKASVIVDPPALGRISVELSSGTSGIEATIKVANEQIRQLVQDQLSQLRMNLSRQGVQVAEFTVDVRQDNSQNQSSQDQSRERRQVNMLGGVAEDEPEEFRVDLEEGLLYWVA